jgi:hypothetical protein
MKLRVYWTDLRGGYVSSVSFRTEVIDEEMNKEVGFIYKAANHAEHDCAGLAETIPGH